MNHFTKTASKALPVALVVLAILISAKFSAMKGESLDDLIAAKTAQTAPADLGAFQIAANGN